MNNVKKDMYLPTWVCWTGLFFIAMAIGCLINVILSPDLLSVIGMIFCFGIGISAVLCWKNQWIQMLDTDSSSTAPCLATKHNMILHKCGS